MSVHPESGRDRYVAYREAFRRERMPTHVRMGAAIALAINTGFAVLDYAAFPESWHLFMLLRAGLNLIFGAVYFYAAERRPGASQITICLSLAGALLLMVYSTGAAMSDYYAGLILLFVAMGVLFPLSALESASICLPVTAAYALSPLVSAPDLDWSRYAIHLVFLVGATIESIASSAFFDRMRFTDYQQRQHIIETNEHLKEMDRLKSRFTANIHHELRTPLTLILAPLESLLAESFGPVEPLQRSYLETARRNAVRLLRLINELLDLARIESHDQVLRRKPVDVAEIATELVQNAGPLASARSIQLALEIPRALPRIHADRSNLEKVLVNLLGNALKFTDRGDRVTVSITPAEGGLEILVTDTGIGIPVDKLERVFDRFAQLDSSSTRRHEGTGIGLALSRELVDLHGGTIGAESEGPGRGTTMRVWLPIGEPDPDDVEAQAQIAGPPDDKSARKRFVDSLAAATGDALEPVLEIQPEPAPDARPPHVPADAAEILIVEDNTEMRRLIAHHLGRDFRLRLAPNGRVALAAIAESKPDLVLTDVMMPELSGTDLCRKLKSDPATAGIPVVLLTSKADREHRISGLELGADDYIQKPFHARELLARIRSLIRLHGLQRELATRNQVLETTNLELQRTMRELHETEVQLIARERLAAVGELAAGIAHEVNNPVNFAFNAVRALLGHVKEIQRVTRAIAELDPDRGDDLASGVAEVQFLQEQIGFDDITGSFDELGRIAIEGLERTTRLVGDFRDFARPRNRGGDDSVDLRRVIDSTLLLVSHNLKSAGINVELTVDDPLPDVPGDARALAQVILNLITNGIDSLEGRRGTIWIDAVAIADGVRLQIRDDGPGIDPRIMKSLFEPFSSTKDSSRNSGLGLSICRRIVVQHGGTIEALRPDEGGACFRITLPRATRPQPHA